MYACFERFDRKKMHRLGLVSYKKRGPAPFTVANGYVFSSYTHTHPTGISRVSVGSWVDKSWGCPRFSPLRGSLQKTFGKSSFCIPKGHGDGAMQQKTHPWMASGWESLSGLSEV